MLARAELDGLAKSRTAASSSPVSSSSSGASATTSAAGGGGGGLSRQKKVRARLRGVVVKSLIVAGSGWLVDVPSTLQANRLWVNTSWFQEEP